MGTEPLVETGLRVRAFFGLPLPEEQLDALRTFLVERSVLSPKFRWTPLENLHITLRFLGQVELSVAQTVAQRIEASPPRGYAIQLGELGTFKRGKLARVLWLGIKLGEAETVAVAAQVDAECARVGLESEKRAYHPHLTLARARSLEGSAIPDEVPPELSPWRADELILYRSHLGRSGPTYEALHRIRFR
jgi:2'-5' RNA ligase